ncbi:MAG: MerR family transcriptional regulator [Armatimonadetes bacterium]|nr:MerR family transcriptional regulator [Armatimonadota bacterium]
MANDDDRDPVYMISIAAARVGMHPQTLRMYERAGLVKPARLGSKRLYSNWDVERLRQIQRLTQDMGVNLAGVEIILNLLDQISELKQEVAEARRSRLPVPLVDDDRYQR